MRYIALNKILIICSIIAILILSFLGYLKPIITFLDSDYLSIFIGDEKVSIYLLLKAIITFSLFLWITSEIIAFLTKKIHNSRRVSRSNKSLMIKGLQIIIYFISFILILDILDINLKALAIFSGAIGIGIGFGLQKITANFISGIILLFEKSIVIDDLVELQNGTSGVVKKTTARYTLLETKDSKEIIIPNEEFITKSVINLTHSTEQARLKINISIGYDDDVEKALDILIQSALKQSRCLHSPYPISFIKAFNDNGIELSLYFWIDNIHLGSLTLKSHIMLDILKQFKHSQITIPYPIREVVMKKNK